MHLLDLDQLSSTDIAGIFRLAEALQRNQEDKRLAGKTIVLFFPETSLRTRITFEKGIRSLGGECILFPPEALDRKERLSDIAKYMENWADGIVIRHASFAKITELAKHSAIPVINALTSENHPCEILADLYSIRERKENYRGLTYTFVGPAGNIGKSWAAIAKVMNLKFNHVSAQGHQLGEQSPNYSFYTELEEALPNSDVVLTDSWPEGFRTEEHLRDYQVTLERMTKARPGALLNPCPPFYRGEEVSAEALASDYFVGYDFKKNLVCVQQAILLYCGV